MIPLLCMYFVLNVIKVYLNISNISGAHKQRELWQFAADVISTHV